MIISSRVQFITKENLIVTKLLMQFFFLNVQNLSNQVVSLCNSNPPQTFQDFLETPSHMLHVNKSPTVAVEWDTAVSFQHIPAGM